MKAEVVEHVQEILKCIILYHWECQLQRRSTDGDGGEDPGTENELMLDYQVLKKMLSAEELLIKM